MKGSFKVLLSVAAVAAIVMMAPAANAQCAPAQVFGSTGLAKLGMVQVEIQGGLTGTEIGNFWASSNSAFANTFAGGCPASLYMVSRNSGDRGVSGGISSSGCIASSCPGTDEEMIFLVEDYTPGPPPGVGGGASFIAFRMSATPANARYWDLALAAGNVAQTLPWTEYPTADVVSSLRAPGVVNTQQQYADLGLNFYGGNAGGAIPDTASIVSWDVCTFHGGGDPGRDRTSWSCDTAIPYTGGPAGPLPFVVECPTIVDDTYVAVGATFTGGNGPNVTSTLVGRAIAIECDPNLADPDNELEQRPRVRPKRRGGR